MRLAKRIGSPVPLYFKVMTEIRDSILSGAWRQGSQLPGELDLAQRLGVSVITVRQALGHLTQEGLVRRERARGTFVSWSGPVNQAINLEFEAENLVTLNPEGTSFKLLRTETIEPPADLSRDFGLTSGEKLTRMTRVRMAHGQPLAYVYSYVPLRVTAKLPQKSLLKLPLSSVIESAWSVKITDVKHLVSAKLADDEVSRHLEIPTGSPVLFVERNYLCKKELVLRTVGFYRSDLFRYEIKLKRGSH
ncbi:MAG: GntR family transcriptional regulator [Candidatus Binatia bacterium]